MQIKGKIFTIIGIVLLFGYFIKDSINPYDPSKDVIMIGNDTLGRDWGAMAEQNARNNAPQQSGYNVADAYDYSKIGNNPYTQNNHQYGMDSSNPYYTNSAPIDQDPFSRPKLNQDNYSSIQSSDGREIITGYARPEEVDNWDTPENNYRKIETRHQKETGEPKMKYRIN